VSILVEAAVDSLDDALAAVEGGADRLELCAALDVGGTTPSEDLMRSVLECVEIPVFAMIRPRGGSFVYTALELSAMRNSIDTARDVGVDGVVFGALDIRNLIDRSATESLVSCAQGFPITFHRAFDRVADQPEALELLIELGVHRVLTSGGAPDALTGADAIRDLVERAGDQIVILAGAGVREHNAREIVELTGVQEVHARAEGSVDRIRGIKRAANGEF
jgi:copper homeostasis protein